MAKKVVYGYIRTSNVSKSAMESDSYPRQSKAIKKFARSKSFKIKEFFWDRGVSGDTGFDLSKRDAYNEMVSLMASNGIREFVVAGADRFARSVITSAVMAESLRELSLTAWDAATGVKLTKAAKDDPEAGMITGILQVISEYEKHRVTQRLMAGRMRAKKMGRYIGGKKAYGKEPGEEKLVARIKELKNFAVSGRRSLQKIADKLHEEGFRTRKGTKLTRQQVHLIAKANCA